MGGLQVGEKYFPSGFNLVGCVRMRAVLTRGMRAVSAQCRQHWRAGARSRARRAGVPPARAGVLSIEMPCRVLVRHTPRGYLAPDGKILSVDGENGPKCETAASKAFYLLVTFECVSKAIYTRL